MRMINAGSKNQKSFLKKCEQNLFSLFTTSQPKAKQ